VVVHLIYNDVLVEWHQGSHATVSSIRDNNGLDEEFIVFRKLIHPLVPAALEPPSLPIVEHMVRIVRAVSHLRKRRLSDAVGLIRGHSKRQGRAARPTVGATSTRAATLLAHSADGHLAVAALRGSPNDPPLEDAPGSS